MQGLIIENISNLYRIKSGNKIYEATPRGKLKKEDITPVVGDKVEIFGDNISIREASRLANANVYKTICSITNRVPRVYVYNDERKEIEY